jgi:hypothetical protein
LNFAIKLLPENAHEDKFKVDRFRVAVHPVNPVELITEGRMRTREP